MSIKHEIGDAVNLTFKITNNGVGVTGLTPVVAVQRISDSQWLDDAKTAWQAGYNDIALAELDATNLPGIYGTDVTQFGGAEQKWRVFYKNTGTYAGIDTEIHEFVTAVWAEATRTLTAGTNIVLAKGTGITGFSDIAAADVWSVATRAITDKAGFNLAADQSGVTVGTVNALGTQAKADVNTEVDAALNTAIPGSPTADSINQRVKAIDDLTQASGVGDLAAVLTALTVSYLTVQADSNNSTLQFKTDLTSSVNDFYKVWLKPRTGGLTGAGPRKVSTYNGTTKIVTLTTPFTSTPAAGDIFDIITE